MKYWAPLSAVHPWQVRFGQTVDVEANGRCGKPRAGIGNWSSYRVTLTLNDMNTLVVAFPNQEEVSISSYSLPIYHVHSTVATIAVMEGSIAADLYGEALQQSSIESCPTSAPDCTLNDAQDNGSDDWCDEDGSSREWESERICNQFVTVGYREGLMAGQEASAQDGFNIGFKQSVFGWIQLGELKERLVEKEEKRHKLKQLHESVHSLSTSDALKLFHEEQTRTSAVHNENPNPDCTQISDEGVLKIIIKSFNHLLLKLLQLKCP
ncbi:uncharacterized protein Fot_28609 [Forsythia ovata]|uniref:Essential protein Yae1 N-terminal domain-containing protein n=1 Tax=Forsythia ovata TaxID=205694 RepID=A0ABD1TQ04_9LAMI